MDRQRVMQARLDAALAQKRPQFFAPPRSTRSKTAKLNGVTPQAYLIETLSQIAAGHPINGISELMPWVYQLPTREAAG